MRRLASYAAPLLVLFLVLLAATILASSGVGRERVVTPRSLTTVYVRTTLLQ